MMENNKEEFTFKDLIRAIKNNETTRRDFWYMLAGCFLTIILAWLIQLISQYSVKILKYLL